MYRHRPRSHKPAGRIRIPGGRAGHPHRCRGWHRDGQRGAQSRALPKRASRSGSGDRKSTRLNSSHANISYAVFCLKKKKMKLGGDYGADYETMVPCHTLLALRHAGLSGSPHKKAGYFSMPSIHFFFFNDTATTEIYTLSLHDALPIYTPNNNRDSQKIPSYVTTKTPRHRSEEHTSELQSRQYLVCRLLLEKK